MADKKQAIPTHLDDGARKRIAEALRAALVDAIDLHSHTKIAHWNIRGPHFAALHPLFDTYATALQGFIDEVGERILVLGELAVGTTRHVAANSRLPEYPQDVTRDLEHVALLLERIDAFLIGLRQSRDVAEGSNDQESVDLLTGIVGEFEKHAWFLRATLGN